MSMPRVKHLQLRGVLSLLVSLGAAIVFAAHVAAVPEGEPNDTGETAETPAADVEYTGSVTGTDEDVWRFPIPAPGLVTLDFAYDLGEPLLRLEGPYGLVGPGREDIGVAHALYRFPADTAGTFQLTISSGSGQPEYRMTFRFSTDLSPIEGTSEDEPNGSPPLANALPANVTSDGRLPSSYRDWDWWMFEVLRQGTATVEVAGVEDLGFVAFEDGEELAKAAGTSAAHIEFEVPRAGWVYINLYRGQAVPTNGSNYTIRWSFAPDLTANWAGVGEVEPNDNASRANTYTPGGTVTGIGDSHHDRADTFSVAGMAGDSVTFWVTFKGTTYDPGSVEAIDPPFEWGIEEGAAQLTFRTSYLFDRESSFVFRVIHNQRDSEYSIASQSRHLEAFDDGIVTLEELNASDVGLNIKLANSGSERLSTGYHLRNADGFMWGLTLCARIATTGNVSSIAIPAGRLFLPFDSSLQVLVSSRTGTFEIPSGEAGCFRAMSHDESGAIGYVFSEYRIGPMLTGDALTIVAHVDQTMKDGPEGVLALWAVTSGTTEERARQWKASDEAIASAKGMLGEAGLQTPLNAPPPGAGIPMIWGLFAVVAVLVIAGLITYARRAGSPPSPPRDHLGGPGTAVQAGGAPPANPAFITAGFASIPAPVASPAPAVIVLPITCPTCASPVPLMAAKCLSCGQPLTWN